MKWNMDDIMKELAEKIEEKTLSDLAQEKISWSKTLDNLLLAHCMETGWTVEDFFLKFHDSEVIDPWQVKRDVECLIATKQMEELFNNQEVY